MDTTTAIAEVRSLLDEPTARKFTDAEIVRWLNISQNFVNAKFEILTTSTTIDLVEDQATYDITSLITDFVKISSGGLQFLNNSKYEPIYPFTSFKQYLIASATTSTSNPTNYAKYGKYIYLYPTPSSDLTDGLKVWYVYKPTQLDTSSNYDLLDGWGEAEVYTDLICLMASLRGKVKDHTKPEDIQNLIIMKNDAMAQVSEIRSKADSWKSRARQKYRRTPIWGINAAETITEP